MEDIGISSAWRGLRNIIFFPLSWLFFAGTDRDVSEALCVLIKSQSTQKGFTYEIVSRNCRYLTNWQLIAISKVDRKCISGCAIK